MKMTYCSDLDVIVIMILYEVRASKKRREWLDAICRLIIWTTLSSETSIPRANLTSTLGCPKKTKSPNFVSQLTPLVFIG